MPIDKNKIQQIVGERHDLLEDMLQLFAKDLQEHLSQFRALAERTMDPIEYQRLLHRLIGSASYFAADDLRTALLHADLLCRQEGSRRLFKEAMEEVYKEIQRILDCDLIRQALTD